MQALSCIDPKYYNVTTKHVHSVITLKHSNTNMHQNKTNNKKGNKLSRTLEEATKYLVAIQD